MKQFLGRKILMFTVLVVFAGILFSFVKIPSNSEINTTTKSLDSALNTEPIHDPKNDLCSDTLFYTYTNKRLGVSAKLPKGNTVNPDPHKDQCFNLRALKVIDDQTSPYFDIVIDSSKLQKKEKGFFEEQKKNGWEPKVRVHIGDTNSLDDTRIFVKSVVGKSCDVKEKESKNEFTVFGTDALPNSEVGWFGTTEGCNSPAAYILHVKNAGTEKKAFLFAPPDSPTFNSLMADWIVFDSFSFIEK